MPEVPGQIAMIPTGVGTSEMPVEVVIIHPYTCKNPAGLERMIEAVHERQRRKQLCAFVAPDSEDRRQYLAQWLYKYIVDPDLLPWVTRGRKFEFYSGRFPVLYLGDVQRSIELIRAVPYFKVVEEIQCT